MTCHAACAHDAMAVQRPAIARVAGGPLVVCVHGILTDTTRRSWCDEFDRWAWVQNRGVKVIKREYWSWFVPAFNVWARNRIQARALAEEIYGFAKDGAGPISIIAHSNGCDIALKTAHRLSALGVKLRSLVLIGAACESDIVRSGIFALVSGGGLARAAAYASANDLALCSKFIWPYGRLGFEGWKLRGDSFSDARIITRWFTPFGHGEYFAAENREKIFDRAWCDCGLPYDAPLGGDR